MLARAVISVSLGAANEINEINVFERPHLLPKLPGGEIEKWCLTPFLWGGDEPDEPLTPIRRARFHHANAGHHHVEELALGKQALGLQIPNDLVVRVALSAQLGDAPLQNH